MSLRATVRQLAEERSNLTYGEFGQKIIVREIASSLPPAGGAPRNDNVEFKMQKEICKQKGFGLILIIIAVLIIAIIAFGTINRKGQIEKAKVIENKAVNDLKVINEKLEKNNKEIKNDL